MDKIGEFRRGLDLETKWDFELSSICGIAVNAYEINDIYDTAPGNDEFQSAVKRAVPDGHTFKVSHLN